MSIIAVIIESALFVVGLGLLFWAFMVASGPRISGSSTGRDDWKPFAGWGAALLALAAIVHWASRGLS